MFAHAPCSIPRLMCVVTGLTACHVDGSCEPSMPAGVHLQVEVLEVVRAASGPECDKITILVGDAFGVTTDVPYASGPEKECLSTSVAGPPEFSNSLNIGTCRPAGSLAGECDVLRSDCDFRARLAVDLIGPDDFDVGTSREMTYSVSLQHAKSGCVHISCSNTYRVQVTRLD